MRCGQSLARQSARIVKNNFINRNQLEERGRKRERRGGKERARERTRRGRRGYGGLEDKIHHVTICTHVELRLALLDNGGVRVACDEESRVNFVFFSCEHSHNHPSCAFSAFEEVLADR